ncbi:C40 family peptidase [bacterium]|nr:C40 family peptidase [bacterium]
MCRSRFLAGGATLHELRLKPHELTDPEKAAALAKEVQSLTLESDANCLGVALEFHLDFGAAVFLGREKALELLASHFAPLKRGDTLEPGDVLTLAFHKEKDLVHAAIYLGDDQFVHKPTLDDDDPVVTDNWKGVAHPYYILDSRNILPRFYRRK